MGSTSELRSLIFYYVNGLLARRWTILITAWIISGIGWFAVAMMPNSYTATARIYVDTESLLRPLMKDLAVQQDVQRQVDVMRRTLLTRPNVEQIVRRTDLDLSVSTPIELEQLIERLAKDIEIRTEGQNIFSIEYSASRPRLAQRIVDTTLQIFVEMNLGDQQQDMESARRFIDQQISEYETKLRNAELTVAEFKRKNSGQLGNADRVQRSLEQAEQDLNNLRSALQSAVWQRDQLSLQLASTPKVLESRTTATGGGERAQLQAELNRQQAELNRLRGIFTERHPDVVAQVNAISRLQAQINAAPAATITREETENPAWTQLNTEFQRMELMIGSIENRIEQQVEKIDNLAQRLSETPETLAELVQLNRDYDVLLKQYQLLIERRESARMAQRLSTESESVEFRIIEPPVEPVQPSGPPRILLMAAVLVGGLGIGTALALLRILLTDAFMNARQLTEAIGLPVIGTLSVARSLLGGPRRVLEAATAVSAALFLLASFGGLSYFYIVNPTPPEFRGIVQGVANSILERFDQSI
tara:strand:- start:24 stop:1622 length:1599 start_codon:yes stop_codon:yes gene_type:complete